MVWPFSSSSKDNDKKGATQSDASSIASSALDSIENAKQMLESTKESLKDLSSDVEDFVDKPKRTMAKYQVKDAISDTLDKIPESVRPYVITSTVFGLGIGVFVLYKSKLRRIPTTDYLTPSSLQGKRILKGRVTSVGDSDNFRFYHTPGGVLAGWGWLRHVPKDSKELKNQTLHIRVAGVDAPEGAHFGMPSQPFSKESLEWLRGELVGKTVLIKPYSKDRYDRVVSMAWYPRSIPFLPKKNVSIEMLKMGFGQVYRQAGSEYGGMLSTFESLEADAKRRKIGIWSLKDHVSAADHKKQYLREKST
ncbi:putative endonuclease lcl3 [Entomortierella beljakovae]|nr:putative endonuclease lcl3 [Entomortierella beljakovae]